MSAGDPPVAAGVPVDGARRALDAAIASSPVGAELLRFFAANRYALLPLDELAGRLFREPDLLRPVVERLAAAGFLACEGRTAVYALTRDPARLQAIDEAAKVRPTPE